MKEEFEAVIVREVYAGFDKWEEEFNIDVLDGELLENKIKKFEGKKVKITIEEIS